MEPPNAAPSPPNPPSVSVIMPVRNAHGLLTDAVDSVLAQEYPGEVELVIADGGPAETSAIIAELADRHQAVRVVPNPAGTTPHGLNAAIEAATGAVIVRCDAASRMPPDYIAVAMATQAESGADNVGGRQVPIGRGFWPRAIAAAMQSRLGAGNARFRVGGPPGATDTVYLGVYPRAVFSRVGLFDERFVRNQDYELNIRIRAAGGQVYFDPALWVAYQVRPSLPSLWRQYFHYGAGRRQTVRIHPGSLKLRQVAPPLLVVALAASALLAVGGLGWPAALVPAAYLLALLLAAVHAAANAGSSAVAVPIALAVMHVSWGLGFLGASRAGEERPGKE